MKTFGLVNLYRKMTTSRCISVLFHFKPFWSIVFVNYYLLFKLFLLHWICYFFPISSNFSWFFYDFQILKKLKQDAERGNQRRIGKAIAILCTVRSTVPEHQPDTLLYAIVHRFLSMSKITWKGLRAMLLFPKSVPQHLSKCLGWKMARSNG